VEAGVFVVWVMVHAQVKRREAEKEDADFAAGNASKSSSSVAAMDYHEEENGGQLEAGGGREE